jgi:hypothetical protein
MPLITTSEGRSIHVFDDLFTFNERTHMHTFIKNSLYSAQGADNSYNDETTSQLFSRWSENELDAFGLFKLPGAAKLLPLIDGRKILQIRCNLTTLSEINDFHVDGVNKDPLTILYYANVIWQPSWGGYTLFANDLVTNIEYASLYTPGRVIVFDGRIPHCICTPTRAAKEHRYSFAVQYER